MTKLKKHPEQKEDEVFIGNIGIESFRHSLYKTKRLGYVAYTSGGKVANTTMRPLFVNVTEYLEIFGNFDNLPFP